mmetsp:Transcript_23457/g.51502  ORF Transcript_23457/g.51502 Transcript_23457/m.51502 type:complete len:86 (+) Transcript_23457:395-652(+)
MAAAQPRAGNKGGNTPALPQIQVCSGILVQHLHIQSCRTKLQAQHLSSMSWLAAVPTTYGYNPVLRSCLLYCYTPDAEESAASLP